MGRYSVTKSKRLYGAIALARIKRLKMHVIDLRSIASIQDLKKEQGTLTMIIAFLLVIAALLIGVFFYVITLQKTQQLGVLKAIGTKNSLFSK